MYCSAAALTGFGGRELDHQPLGPPGNRSG